MKDFDFDNLAALAQNNPQAFEVERKRLIRAALREVPESSRARCEALQDELDAARLTMTPERFMAELAARMQANLDDLEDQMRAVVTLVERDAEHKPLLNSLSKPDQLK
jgi:hypothetical protein